MSHRDWSVHYTDSVRFETLEAILRGQERLIGKPLDVETGFTADRSTRVSLLSCELPPTAYRSTSSPMSIAVLAARSASGPGRKGKGC